MYYIFFYRFGKHYEIPLLLQSIFMIVTMFIMIKLCISVQSRNQVIKVRERVFSGKFKYNKINANNIYINYI